MTCSICKTDKGSIVEAKDNDTSETFNYWECDSCGVVSLIERPRDYSKYYSSTYYSLSGNQPGGIAGKVKGMRDRYLISGKGFAGKIISQLLPNANLKALQALAIDNQKSVLDVGCGTGKEIALLRENGNQHAHGIDPFINGDILLENKVLVQKKDVYEVEGKYDLITLHHSFEHMDEPLKVLMKLKEHLNEGGKIMIRIPVADSYAYQKFGTSWVQFDAPRHIFLHTKKSMALLAENAGLTIESVYSDSSSFQFWGTRINKKGMSIHTARKKKVLAEQFISFIKNEKGFARKLNQSNSGDQAVFILADAV